MKLLFICNQNENRSKTTENLYKDKYETKSAGFYSEKNIINRNLMQWADLIIVFEKHHLKEINEKFPQEYLSKKIINLDIPDIYNYNNEKLIEEFERKFDFMLKKSDKTRRNVISYSEFNSSKDQIEEK